MTGEKRMFSSYEKNEDPQRAITFGDGNQGLVKGLGKIAISPDHSISNVFLVDSLDYNLLSVSQLCKMGSNCLFSDTGVTVFRRSDDSVAFMGVLEGQLYLVDFNRTELDTCLIAKTNMGWLWHRRLAHVGMKNLHKLLKREHILGLTNVHFEKDTACYSINWLYLHRILKKTSYELLTGKKPNVSYFRVFGSKCFILIKRGRKSKFAPKAVEGFLLGYDSNTRAYRVFNKSTRLVEVSCDIVFDETNGSQVEQVNLDELDDEEAPCIALRNMSIGYVCPKESEEPPQAQDQPLSSNQASLPTQDEDQAQDNEDEDQEDEPPQEEDNDQGGDDNDKDKEDEQEVQGQKPPHPRVHQAIQRDHPVNSILCDIHKGVTTQS
jgi:hypothetical protein